MLTKEERAAKFAVKKDDVGLRSRGHRKLTRVEQQRLYDNLGHQAPGPRLDQLRMLREAVQSADPTEKDPEFELKVYETSVEECILNGQLEVVPHMLAHITTISDSNFWTRLNVISLSNKKHFHHALLLCSKTVDWQYVTSIVNKDVPLWESLVAEEQNAIAKALMMQMKSEHERIKQESRTTHRHPGGTPSRVKTQG